MPAWGPIPRRALIQGLRALGFGGPFSGGRHQFMVRGDLVHHRTACTANVTYTPAGNYSGPDSFTFKASDDQFDSNVVTVSITVSAFNDPPTASDQSATTAQTTAITLTLSASDLDSASLSFSIVTGPSHGTLGSITGTSCTPNGSGGSSCTASVTYTPAGYAGPDTFSYKAYDGTAYSSEAKVSLTVTGTNYTFAGFFQPAGNPPTVNTVNAGQTIPEKWQLFAATGAAISDPTSFVSFTSYQVSCTTWLGVTPRPPSTRSRQVRRACSTWATGTGNSTGRHRRAGPRRAGKPCSR